MRALFLVGRALFGGFFLYSGLNHFQHHDNMSGYAAAKGVPKPDVAVHATGAMLVAGGASVIAGLKPRQGLATLLAFLVPATLQMHRFWDVEDPAARMNESIHFMKNVALVGAALMLLQIDQPWPASVDALVAEDDEMYVRLGGRDLRALPA